MSTPRLRLYLRGLTYFYRWELLGKYTRWHKGHASRLLTVERAFQRLRSVQILGD